jgi:putative ABC transport system ATP-binding protein
MVAETTRPPVGARLEASGLVRDFPSGEGLMRVLDGLDLRVDAGAVIAVTGRSGAGKTTLLNLLGGLDRPTAGTATVDGRLLGSLSDAALAALRREEVAFVFQAPSLVPILSAAENVEVPLRLRGVAPGARDARVQEALDEVGLGARARHRPDELSGGEQQRVALARGMVGRPRILLADEPTAQLDHETALGVAALIRRHADRDGLTVVLASHDPSLLAIADEVLLLREGRLEPAGAASGARARPG